jgi:serine/threonine protein phosphatase PrpC
MSTERKGTHIITKKWLKSTSPSKKLYPLDFGGATRPYPGYNINGDAFIIKRWDKFVLLGVIDGLGHGPLANKASREALRYIKRNFNQPIRQLMLGTNMAVKNTRGVVLSLALFNLNTLKITFSGIGNIETRTYRKKLERNFISHRGILGRNIPTPRIIEAYWKPGMIMVFFSDGIESSLDWEEYSHLSEKPANLIAYKILEDLGKDRDDATVVIVKDFSDQPDKS